MWRSIGLQSEFAERVLALHKPTLLVLTNGGPLAIDPLVHTTRQNIIAGPAAIIEAFNPNTNGATALAKEATRAETLRVVEIERKHI